MINQKDIEKLTGSLLRMFGYAEADAVRVASFQPIPEKDKASEATLVSKENNTKLPDKQFKVLKECRESLSSDEPIATKGQTVAPKSQIRTPQAFAFLLATGQIVGGVAVNPLNSKNPNAENAIKIAYEEFELLCASGRIRTSEIVGGAITIIEDQASEYVIDELSEAFAKLGIKGLVLVDPKTGKSEYSAHPFPISTPECA